MQKQGQVSVWRLQETTKSQTWTLNPYRGADEQHAIACLARTAWMGRASLTPRLTRAPMGSDYNGRILVVSHTFRRIDERSVRIRIISSKKATKNERKQYEE